MSTPKGPALFRLAAAHLPPVLHQSRKAVTRRCQRSGSPAAARRRGPSPAPGAGPPTNSNPIRSPALRSNRGRNPSRSARINLIGPPTRSETFRSNPGPHGGPFRSSLGGAHHRAAKSPSCRATSPTATSRAGVGPMSSVFATLFPNGNRPKSKCPLEIARTIAQGAPR